MCSKPADWPWSSYPATLGLAPAQPFLATDWVLAQFGPDRESAREGLQLFVDADPFPAVQLCSGVYAAGEPYLRRHVGKRTPLQEVPRRQWQPIPPTLTEIFTTSSQPVAAAYRDYGYSLRDIADHLGCHYSTASRRLRREETA